MSRVGIRGVITAVVVILALIILYPNFAPRKLGIVFLDSYRSEEGELIRVNPERRTEFLNDSKIGFLYHFPGQECKPEAKGNISADRRCVVHKRFLTTAEVNEIVQAYPNVIDEALTGMEPHPIEDFFGFLSEEGSKVLTIKLGLDLQGGMRAVFSADYEVYLDRLQEKYNPIVADLKEDINNPAVSQEDKNSAKNRLANIERLLELSEERKIELLDEAKRIIDKRLVAQNLTEPIVQVQPGSYSIAVDMPGVANSQDVLSKIRDTVTVEYRLVNEAATQRVNSGEYLDELRRLREIYKQDRVDRYEAEQILEKVSEDAGITPEEGRLFLYWSRPQNGNKQLPSGYRVLGPAVMDGSDMTDAQPALNPASPWYSINFSLSGPGADKFADLTTENVGRQMAILWGDRVVSDPSINTPIVQGNGVITGQFSEDEAKEVANVIREGALPLPLEVISVSFVGPTLGRASIEAGIFSLFIGFLLVNVFMVIYYRLTGLVAVLTLLLNLVIMTALLSLMEFTLTLPGFAGLILTVGMAVDANVIIFEKIKEDLRAGRSVSAAIESGFDSSFWTILDANVTTLIAAVILYYNGDGPIRGFAITLFFGLVTSMFTALYVSRFFFDFATDVFRINKLSIGLRLKK